jgi:hypothetical protein
MQIGEEREREREREGERKGERERDRKTKRTLSLHNSGYRLTLSYRLLFTPTPKRHNATLLKPNASKRERKRNRRKKKREESGEKR